MLGLFPVLPFPVGWPWVFTLGKWESFYGIEFMGFRDD